MATKIWLTLDASSMHHDNGCQTSRIFSQQKTITSSTEESTKIKGIEIGLRMINIKNYQAPSLRPWLMILSNLIIV